MGRKLISMLFIFLAIAFLGGCADKKTESGKDKKMQVGEVSIQGEVFSVTSPFESMKEKLGEPENYQESKSCLYDGFDKTYQYSNLIITTYPSKGKEYISSITLLKNTKDLDYQSYVKLGESKKNLEKALQGKKYGTSPTCYQLEEEKVGFAFYLEGENVTKIEIYSITK
ncbi:MAG: hypothetical protein KA953_00025 [Lachnospiraceae bacterium]|nr:hypothetical protein [Lachnospiraceae bacterium]